MYLRTRVSVYSCISVLVYQRTYNIGSAEYYRTGVVGECITNILISIYIYTPFISVLEEYYRTNVVEYLHKLEVNYPIPLPHSPFSISEDRFLSHTLKESVDSSSFCTHPYT